MFMLMKKFLEKVFIKFMNKYFGLLYKRFYLDNHLQN